MLSSPDMDYLFDLLLKGLAIYLILYTLFEYILYSY